MTQETDPFLRLAVIERARVLEECRRVLTLQQAILLHQRYVLDTPMVRIAAMFRVMESAVSNMHRRAIRALRTELARRKVHARKDLI